MSKNKGRQKGHGAKDGAAAMGEGSRRVESPEYDANLGAGEASRRLNAEPEVRVAEQTSEICRTYEAVNLERQRFYDLLETLPAYVVLLSQDYRVPFANRFFRERFGESHGRCCFEYLFGRTEPCEICETYKVLKTNAPHRWEWTGPDGRIYDIYDFPFTDTNGSPLIMEMGIDITERKQAETALKEANETLERRVAERTAALATSEKRLRLAQEAANAGTWEWDLRTNRNFWSEELWKLYGLEPYSCEPSYEAWRQTIHPDDRAAAEQTVEAAARLGVELNAEWRVCLPSGAQRWLMSRGQPMRDAEGQVARYIGIVVDITERKRVEEALCEAHERTAWLARFPEENPNPVLRASADGSVLYCNPASVGMHGWACRVGQPLSDLLLRLVGQAMTKGQEVQQDVEIDGRFYFVSVAPFPEEGYANIYGRDITDRKRTEEALRQRTSELQQLTGTLEQRVQERTAELAKANEVLRHLSSRLLSAQEDERKRLAGEIHDTLGASLSAIKFKVEDAREQIGKSGNAASESLNAIVSVVQESIDECRRIQMDLRPSMLDDLGLLVTLSWFCRRFQTIYSAIRIEQEIEIREDEVPNVLKTAIYRVTQEAMNNIAKHSHADVVRLSFRKMDGKMELTFQDNGWGFNLEKVRSQETMKRGLGLLSMRERTELSGGSFAIESAEGKGTTIRASWPL